VPGSVDVVIVAYNRWDLTESCLRHLQAQTIDHRVIVVDNGSTDDTTRARLRSEWSDVQLELFEENQFFPRACNRGVAAGTAEFVVLLNNDVDCRPDFLERLVRPLRCDPGLGSVCALLLQRGDELIDGFGLSADVTLAAFPRLRGLSVAHAGDSSLTLLGPGGAAAAYRREAWEQLGGLDESLASYMEDFDLAVRLRIAGWGTAVEVNAIGTHVGSATHGHRSPSTRGNGGFGRGYMLRRYGLLRGRTAPRVLATEAIVVLGDMLISRDLVALRGRVAGWRAARGRPRLGPPPADSIEKGIGFWDSLARRWRGYGVRLFRRRGPATGAPEADDARAVTGSGR
jgi:N-acetylglucosaminyl-diphospho-decaprenol L-rhamnosyltransferase